VICTKCRSIDCHPNGQAGGRLALTLVAESGIAVQLKLPTEVTYIIIRQVAQLSLIVPKLAKNWISFFPLCDKIRFRHLSCNLLVFFLQTGHYSGLVTEQNF
jgi:hypothetical protein